MSIGVTPTIRRTLFVITDCYYYSQNFRCQTKFHITNADIISQQGANFEEKKQLEMKGDAMCRDYILSIERNAFLVVFAWNSDFNEVNFWFCRFFLLMFFFALLNHNQSMTPAYKTIFHTFFHLTIQWRIDPIWTVVRELFVLFTYSHFCILPAAAKIEISYDFVCSFFHFWRFIDQEIIRNNEITCF